MGIDMEYDNHAVDEMATEKLIEEAEKRIQALVDDDFTMAGLLRLEGVLKKLETVREIDLDERIDEELLSEYLERTEALPNCCSSKTVSVSVPPTRSSRIPSLSAVMLLLLPFSRSRHRS